LPPEIFIEWCLADYYVRDRFFQQLKKGETVFAENCPNIKTGKEKNFPLSALTIQRLFAELTFWEGNISPEYCTGEYAE
jgi:hypothetical protein